MRPGPRSSERALELSRPKEIKTGPDFLSRNPARLEGQRARELHFVRSALFVFGPSNLDTREFFLRDVFSFGSFGTAAKRGA